MLLWSSRWVLLCQDGGGYSRDRRKADRDGRLRFQWLPALFDSEIDLVSGPLVGCRFHEEFYRQEDVHALVRVGGEPFTKYLGVIVFVVCRESSPLSIYFFPTNSPSVATSVAEDFSHLVCLGACIYEAAGD